MQSSAERYIARIKNWNKKAYASAYLEWLRNGENGPSPDYVGLGYMGAQAVRLNLEMFEKVPATSLPDQGK